MNQALYIVALLALVCVSQVASLGATKFRCDAQFDCYNCLFPHENCVWDVVASHCFDKADNTTGNVTLIPSELSDLGACPELQCPLRGIAYTPSVCSPLGRWSPLIYVIDIVAVTAFWIVILIIQRSLTPSYQRTTLQATRHALLNIDHSAEHRPELCRWCGTVYTPSGRRPTFAMCDACGMYIVLEELFVAAALTTVGNVGSWMSLDNSLLGFLTGFIPPFVTLVSFGLIALIPRFRTAIREARPSMFWRKTTSEGIPLRDTPMVGLGGTPDYADSNLDWMSELPVDGAMVSEIKHCLNPEEVIVWAETSPKWPGRGSHFSDELVIIDTNIFRMMTTLFSYAMVVAAHPAVLLTNVVPIILGAIILYYFTLRRKCVLMTKERLMVARLTAFGYVHVSSLPLDLTKTIEISSQHAYISDNAEAESGVWGESTVSVYPRWRQSNEEPRRAASLEFTALETGPFVDQLTRAATPFPRDTSEEPQPVKSVAHYLGFAVVLVSIAIPVAIFIGNGSVWFILPFALAFGGVGLWAAIGFFRRASKARKIVYRRPDM